MTQPITPKSPSEILEEFDRDEQRHNSLVYSGERSKHEREFLLSAMRSLLEHVVEMMPKGENDDIELCVSAIRKVQSEIE
jgi:hypothetical protein